MNRSDVATSTIATSIRGADMAWQMEQLEQSCGFCPGECSSVFSFDPFASAGPLWNSHGQNREPTAVKKPA